MNSIIGAIYARQLLDKKDSLSLEGLNFANKNLLPQPARLQNGRKGSLWLPYRVYQNDGISIKKLVEKPDEVANIDQCSSCTQNRLWGYYTTLCRARNFQLRGRSYPVSSGVYSSQSRLCVDRNWRVRIFQKSGNGHFVNDAADFTGMNMCYLYQGRDVK